MDDGEVQQGPNLYAYVGDNPVNLTDPLGLCCEREAEVATEAAWAAVVCSAKKEEEGDPDASNILTGPCKDQWKACVLGK